LVDIQGAPRELSGQDGVQQLPGPRLPLEQQVDGEGLEFGFERRQLGQHDLGDLRVIQPPERRQNTGEEPRRARGEDLADNLGQRGVLERNQGVQSLEADGLGLVHRGESLPDESGVERTDPKPGGKQLGVER